MKLFELQSTVIKWVISIFVLPDVPTKCEKRPFPSKKFVKLKWFMRYYLARIKCFDYFGNKLDDLTGKWGKSNFYNSNIFPWNYFGYVVKSKQTLPFDGKIQLLEFYFFCEITLDSKYMTYFKNTFPSKKIVKLKWFLHCLARIFRFVILTDFLVKLVGTFRMLNLT